MWQDALAAREWKVSMFRWLTWALSCEAKRLLAWDDPMPLVRGSLWRVWPHRGAENAAKKSDRLRELIATTVSEEELAG